MCYHCHTYVSIGIVGMYSIYNSPNFKRINFYILEIERYNIIKV